MPVVYSSCEGCVLPIGSHMTFKLKLLILLLTISLLAVVVLGCGGGKGGDPQYAGSATLTILWPTKAVKAADPQSVKIVISTGTQTVAERTANRPSQDGATSVDFPNLPSGTYTATVTAYPLANAGGSAISQASSQLVVQTGTNTKLSFTTSAAVDRIEVTAANTSVTANGTTALTATPMTADGVVVLVPAGSITWDSANNSIASVDSTGTVTGHASGNVDITATESASGQSGSLRITVSATKWTVMVYMAADNNLEAFGIGDMNEMEQVGSNSDVTVVVQIDRSSDYDTSNGNWIGARRYLVTKDNDQSTIHSTMLQDLGNTNMASPQTLTNFIQWATSTYPADHYMLVLWDHGRGWRGGTTAMEIQQMPMKAILVDDSYNGAEMSLAGLTQALSNAPHTDLVFFDACLMGMLEVAHAIRNSAEVMVASEDDVPADGAPYDQVLNHLETAPGMSAQTLGQIMTDEYVSSYAGWYSGAITMSAVNLHSVDQLTTAADQFSDAVLANMSEVKAAVRNALAATQSFDKASAQYTDYRDLYDFARLVNANVTNTSVKSAAQNVMSAVNSLVIREGHSGLDVPNAVGISIYLPNPGDMIPSYSNMSFSQATSWDDMLSQY